MAETETGVKQARKAPRRGAGAAGIESLRIEAARQLKERLEGGKLSTGDLLKVMNMAPTAAEAPKAHRGDWVLKLKEDV